MTPRARAHIRLQQALDEPRIGWLWTNKLRQAAACFRDAGMPDAAETCERAAERCYGDDSALCELERERADG